MPAAGSAAPSSPAVVLARRVIEQARDKAPTTAAAGPRKPTPARKPADTPAPATERIAAAPTPARDAADGDWETF